MSTEQSIQTQIKTLEVLRAQPYFRCFEPRHYATYDNRLYDPIAYLDDIGIELISDMVQSKIGLDKICHTLDVSSRVMRRWLNNNPGHWEEVKSARRWSADAFAHSSRDLWKNMSPSNFNEEAVRAKGLTDAEKFLAQAYDQETFSSKSVNVKGQVEHTVAFNIGLDFTRKTRGVLEGVAQKVEQLPAPESIEERLEVINAAGNQL